MPSLKNRVGLYDGEDPVFDKYGIEVEITRALGQKVWLKSGGYIIVEQTEALTVIDVNTGKFTGTGSMEDTILKTNLEAADEIVTQLRLRNIGGLIVIDFIDLANASNRNKLSRFLEKTLKEKDKYQSVTLRISEFGLVQMTRKRSGKTLLQQLTHTCSTCDGSGFVKSIPSISFQVLRNFKTEVIEKKLTGSIILSVSPKVFEYLIHQEYQSILQLEKSLGCKAIIESNELFNDTQFNVSKM